MIWNIFIGLLIIFLIVFGSLVSIGKGSFGPAMLIGGLILLIVAVWPAHALEIMI